MSISPNDANRSVPVTPLNNPLKNPNSHHGFVDRDTHRRIESLSLQHSRGGPARSAHVAGAEIAGSAVAHFGGSCESDKNVTKHRSSHAMKGSYDQNNGIFSLGQQTAQGGISSEFGPDQFGPLINRQLPGTGKLLQSDPSASGPSELQGNAVQSVSRRNQVGNANHLLNFFYDPISRPLPRALPPRRQRKIKPYNRDLFLQATYKFVVLDTGNYHVELMDPDKMLQWEDIICVRFSAPVAVQCPICLETPLCPQITSCGHIYCFPCILRYLLMGKEDHKGDCWKKCPLCFMMISSKDLCTIQIENVKQFDIGDHVHFVLLTRRKDSLVPSPKYQQEECPMQYSSNELRHSFSKFILTSDVKLSVQEAKSDLNNWLIKAESGGVDDLERLPYVCAALEQLEERIKNWMDQLAVSDTPLINSSATSKCGRTIDNDPKHEVPDESSISFSHAPKFSGSPLKGLLFDKDRASQCSSDAGGGDSYTFYQAIDGQHLILHPLNMKCLLYHYGSYDMLPSRINGRILEMETLTQSEVMRKRYRFLSHFSLTTSIQLCEVDLGEILPPSSLAPFQDEIKNREKKRRQVARKERNEKARADAAAALHMMPIIYDQKFSRPKDATFSSDDFEALGRGAAPSTSPPINSEKKLFSDVARLGFAAAHDSPSLKGEGSADHMEKIGDTSNTQGTRQMATTLSFASIMSAAKVTGAPAVRSNNGVAKKGKKPTKVLLSTAGGRRY